MVGFGSMSPARTRPQMSSAGCVGMVKKILDIAPVVASRSRADPIRAARLTVFLASGTKIDRESPVSGRLCRAPRPNRETRRNRKWEEQRSQDEVENDGRLQNTYTRRKTRRGNETRMRVEEDEEKYVQDRGGLGLQILRFAQLESRFARRCFAPLNAAQSGSTLRADGFASTVTSSTQSTDPSAQARPLRDDTRRDTERHRAGHRNVPHDPALDAKR